MEIHFLTDEPLDSAWVRYRCVHLQEQLASQGITASLDHVATARSVSLPGEVVVLFRTAYGERIQRVVDVCRARGKAVVFGTDDLLFTFDFVWKQLQDQKASRPEGRGQPIAADDYWHAYMQRRRETLLRCDGALVSTEFLAARVRALGKPAWVVRNGLSAEMERQAREVGRDRDGTGGRVMLGYLAGTATHDYDFGEIAGVVAGLMRRHPHVYLTVVGPVNVPGCLEEFGTRVRRCPLLAWRHLPGVLGNLDINLAPLDMLTLFNHAKSEVKWLEAAAVGVVTVASRTAGFSEAVRHGETGLLAGTPAEWERMLEDLVTQPELRARLGSAARREAEQRYTVKAQGPQTAQVFAEIAQASGRVPGGDGPGPVVHLPPAAGRRLGLRARLGRVIGQTARNVKRLLNPFFWERVLRRWEGAAAEEHEPGGWRPAPP